mmetsp:Transcript_23655/g.66807  ORF Transcript_23655/g.66807 Transcript_23655/m.66807 type:complete len:467 (-) Transcript_23655:1695-3095(-)
MSEHADEDGGSLLTSTNDHHNVAAPNGPEGDGTSVISNPAASSDGNRNDNGNTSDAASPDDLLKEAKQSQSQAKPTATTSQDDRPSARPVRFLPRVQVTDGTTTSSSQLMRPSYSSISINVSEAATDDAVTPRPITATSLSRSDSRRRRASRRNLIGASDRKSRFNAPTRNSGTSASAVSDIDMAQAKLDAMEKQQAQSQYATKSGVAGASRRSNNMSEKDFHNNMDKWNAAMMMGQSSSAAGATAVRLGGGQHDKSMKSDSYHHHTSTDDDDDDNNTEELLSPYNGHPMEDAKMKANPGAVRIEQQQQRIGKLNRTLSGSSDGSAPALFADDCDFDGNNDDNSNNYSNNNNAVPTNRSNHSNNELYTSSDDDFSYNSRDYEFNPTDPSHMLNRLRNEAGRDSRPAPMDDETTVTTVNLFESSGHTSEPIHITTGMVIASPVVADLAENTDEIVREAIMRDREKQQ